MRACGWICLLALTAPALVGAQDALPLVESPDTHYFDFWVGTWYRIVNGRVDTSATRFQVTRGVHPGALEETWRMVVDTNRVAARAFRAWDKTRGRWMYVWVSDNGLFQAWEGRRVGADWYFFHEFDIQGDRYLSRQGWLPAGPDRATRVSERSVDGGRTWQLRFREEYRRVTP
jgi:hypothetical protein